MSDRKLRLVPPPQGTEPAQEAPPEVASGAIDEPPFDEAELAEAVRLREALERGDEPVSSSLRAAHHPAPLDDVDHEALIARALGDAAAPPTRVEQEAAERLRAALEGAPVAPFDDATADALGLARALRAAHAPAPLAPLVHEAMVARAVANAPRRRRAEIATTVFGALAMAAAVTLFFVTRDRDRHAESAAGVLAPAPAASAATSPPALVRARSTMDLFPASEPFPRTGGESSRVDRIAGARAADLRANRYSRWGVR